jgi:peptidoglycan/xylan/chitin deacetylase (PgdA/CDA1 family)
MRCGLPRIFDLLDRRGIKASAWTNAQCADVYPSAAKRAVAAESAAQWGNPAGQIQRAGIWAAPQIPRLLGRALPHLAPSAMTII